MKYPIHKVYRELYARYFKRDSEELFKGIDLKDKTVLDVCCGGGRATACVLFGGAKEVFALDNSLDMVPSFIRDNTDKIHFIWSHAQDYLSSPNVNQKFDIIVCQQGINYWFNSLKDKGSIADKLNKDGVFIFNTFNTIPSKVPTVKQYSLDDVSYCEISYLVDKTVHHAQCAEGLPIHTTEFDWISPEQFMEELSPHFKCNVIIDGATSIWYCSPLKNYE